MLLGDDDPFKLLAWVNNKRKEIFNPYTFDVRYDLRTNLLKEGGNDTIPRSKYMTKESLDF